MSRALLEIQHLDKHFGGLHVLKDINISVAQGEIVGILGPNGAGKTTLFNLITGFIPADEGHVSFRGHSLRKMKSNAIVGLGVARTFQLCRPFVGLTVLENVLVGSLGPRVKSDDLGQRAMDLLDQVGLLAKAHTPSELLSYGDLRRLEIARALATDPELLLLDEPFAGLGSSEIEALSTLIRQLHKEQKLTILLIEHRLREFMQLVSRVVAEQLERSGEVNFAARLAHYLCEQARELITQGDQAGAAKLLLEAISQAPEAARARLLLGQLQLSMGQAAQALATLTHLFEAPALAAPLAAASLARAALAAQASEQGLEILQAHYALSPCIDVMQAIVSLQTEQDSPEGAQTARQRYIEHLKLQPSLIAASRWLAGETSLSQEDHAAVQKALEQAARPLARYRCAACGFEAKEHFWHCPGCQAWDSYPARRIEEL